MIGMFEQRRRKVWLVISNIMFEQQRSRGKQVGSWENSEMFEERRASW